MPLRSDLLLLALAGALLLFGGGIGCEPELEGTQLRVLTTDAGLHYAAFQGKKAPGDGDAQLPFALIPPFGVAARMGVFDARALAASAGAEGCIGLRDTGSADEHRLCARYDDDPPAVYVRFGGEQAECPGAQLVRLELAVDAAGDVLAARYRCPGGALVELTTVDALWDEGEAWNLFVAASGLGKRGQAAFDDFAVESGGVGIGDPRETAFVAFEAFRLGLEAFYELEDGDPNVAFQLASEAVGKLQFAATAASDPLARKLLGKAASTAEKLLVSGPKYLKGFPKAAVLEADALEALDAAP